MSALAGTLSCLTAFGEPAGVKASEGEPRP
jgi:hypothetical protein